LPLGVERQRDAIVASAYSGRLRRVIENVPILATEADT
jgi:hypothetical protein